MGHAGSQQCDALHIVAKMCVSGRVTSGGDVLSMNFLLDRSSEGWVRELATLNAQFGNCETNAPIVPTGSLSGDFKWRREHCRLKDSLLAPTPAPRAADPVAGPRRSVGRSTCCTAPTCPIA